MNGSRLLDRYVLLQWLRIFVLTSLGFPIVAITINLTDKLSHLLDRGLSWHDILISYVYGIPENMFLIMPAAVLFATVFTVGAMGRHSEITAAKASGISFFRLARPIFIASALAMLLTFAVGELAVGATARMNKIQSAGQSDIAASRFNFVYRGNAGWVYTIQSLDIAAKRLDRVVFERQGQSADYPDLVVSADSATYDSKSHEWELWHGTSRIISDASHQAAFGFQTMRLRAITQSPSELLVEPKAPEEMRYEELGRYIDAMRRSGNDVAKLRVDQALKIALPAACIVIALFGAPLAITTPRSSSAAGTAVSLGTTVMFLLLAQIARAVGNGGAINPVLAAWLPNIVFAVIAVGLLGRVRS